MASSGICQALQIGSLAPFDLPLCRSFSTQCIKSVVDRTPMQRPLASTTGAPVTPARDNIRAAPCSDISRGTITTCADMMSAAQSASKDLLVRVISHLPGVEFHFRDLKKEQSVCQ